MGIPTTEMVSFMAMVFPRSFPLGAPAMLHRQYLQCNSDLCIMQLNCQETHHGNTNNSLCVTLCTGIQGSLGFWLPYHGFRIPSAEFWIPNSKAQESRLYSKNLLIQHSTSKNFPDSGIWIVPYMG